MKTLKRTLAILLTLTMVFSLCTVASAVGSTASIVVTASDDGTVSVDGKTISIYKIFSAAGSGTNISYSWDNATYKTFFKNYFNEISGGTIDINDSNVNNITHVVQAITALKGSATAMHDFAVALEKYIEDNSITATETKVATGNTLVFDSLSYGYYLLKDDTTTGVGSDVLSGVMLTTATGDVTVNVKASKPTLEKVVYALTDSSVDTWDELQGSNPTELNAKGVSASLDQNVWYKVTTNVPDTTTYTNGYILRLCDEYSDAGIEAIPDSLHVMVGTTDISDRYNGNELGTTDGLVFDTSVTDASGKVFPDHASISVYYCAKLNENITEALINTAKLWYTKDSSIDASAPGNETSVVSTAVVYTNLLAISKRAAGLGGTTTTTLLEGAEFEIYRVNSSNNRIGDALKFNKVTGTDGYPQYVISESGATTTLVVNSADESAGMTPDSSLWGDDMGTVRIYGLGEGKYEVVETKAPDGYILPTASYYMNIDNTYGPVTGDAIGVDVIVEDGDATDGAEIRLSSSDPEKQHAHLTISNRSGELLPETGGIGATVFIGGGIILMMIAGCYFILLKKKKSMAK